MGDVEYPREHSRKVGLTVSCLIDNCEELASLIIYDLSLLRKAHNIPWAQFYDWTKALSGESITMTFSS